MTDFRYKAFVSYSWADAQWGKWLLHAIETYRTPAALVGKDGAHGPVPARLQPLFKDREEEAAGASIGAAVDAALAASEFLIVLCSPRSAQSQWVNHEVAWFKTHRNPANILALIVDGEPGAGENDCFPRALTHRVNPDLTVSDEPVDAPLAADARISGDGKRKARLKLAAAMLGVGLDELVNRDDRRRTIRTRIVVGVSLALAMVMSGMAWAAVVARNEADRQRAESDGLVEFMLTDLRERLEPVGRLDALDVVGKRALRYYAGQKASSLDADALGRRARALHLVGEVSNIRGDSVAGLTAFREAAATTAEQLARDPDDPQRIFDHAQSVFWVGYIAYERGETKEAEAQFREYKRLADRLVELDPKKPEWQMEVSYAESNLGVLYYDQGRYAEAEPAFAKALAMVETVAAGEKQSAGRQLEVGVAINWLAKSQAGAGKFAAALKQHQREIAIYQGILGSDLANTRAKWRVAVAWQHVGQLEQLEGRSDATIIAYKASLQLMSQLRGMEPGNTEWQETTVRGLDGLFGALTYSGKSAEARALYGEANSLLDQLVRKDPKNKIWAVYLRAALEVRGARLALAEGNPALAFELASSSMKRIGPVSNAALPEVNRVAAEAGVLAGDAAARLARRGEALSLWQGALARLDANPIDFQFANLRLRYVVFRRLGRTREAAAIAATLDRQGYRHPAYLREK